MGLWRPNHAEGKENKRQSKVLLFARSICLQTCLMAVESWGSCVSLAHHQPAFIQGWGVMLDLSNDKWILVVFKKKINEKNMKCLWKVCGLIQLMKNEKSLMIIIKKLITIKTSICEHLNQIILGNNLSQFESLQTAFRHLLAINRLHF